MSVRDWLGKEVEITTYEDGIWRVARWGVLFCLCSLEMRCPVKLGCRERKGGVRRVTKFVINHVPDLSWSDFVPRPLTLIATTLLWPEHHNGSSSDLQSPYSLLQTPHLQTEQWIFISIHWKNFDTRTPRTSDYLLVDGRAHHTCCSPWLTLQAYLFVGALKPCWDGFIAALHGCRGPRRIRSIFSGRCLSWSH